MPPTPIFIESFKSIKTDLGVSTVEYVLIGVFVVLVSIAGFKLLNVNVGNALAEVKTDFNSHSVAAQKGALADQASIANNGAIDAVNDTGSSTINAISSEVGGITASELGSVIATSGANGATTMLADQMATLAKQLLDANKITEAQYNALIALANQGHNLANIEQKFENIVANSRNTQEMDTKISNTKELVGHFEGPYTYYSIGFTTESINSLDPIKDPLSMDPSVGSPATRVFLEAYQSALQSGALNDPTIKQIIDGLAGDIAYISQVVGAATGQISGGQLDPDKMRTSMAAAITHQASASICSVGSGKDNGTQCTASSER